jgi:hypothetical protein
MQIYLRDARHHLAAVPAAGTGPILGMAGIARSA